MPSRADFWIAFVSTSTHRLKKSIHRKLHGAIEEGNFGGVRQNAVEEKLESEKYSCGEFLCSLTSEEVEGVWWDQIWEVYSIPADSWVGLELREIFASYSAAKKYSTPPPQMASVRKLRSSLCGDFTFQRSAHIQNGYPTVAWWRKTVIASISCYLYSTDVNN